MVARHYQKPHRFICVTDDPVGLHAEIEAVPLWTDAADVPNPTWPDGPSCYRRLKMFSAEFAEIAGSRFVCMDIDTVPVADLSPLFDRPEDFLIWRPGGSRIPLCASMILMTAGSRRIVWDYFLKCGYKEGSAMASRAGYRGSDQAWVTFCLGEATPGWTKADGVYGYSQIIPARPSSRRGRRDIPLPRSAIRRGYGMPGAGPLPPNARLIIFTGKPDPWDGEAITMSPWLKEHYR